MVFDLIEDIFMTVVVPLYQLMKKTDSLKYGAIGIIALVVLKVVLFFISGMFKDKPLVRNKESNIYMDAQDIAGVSSFFFLNKLFYKDFINNG